MRSSAQFFWVLFTMKDYILVNICFNGAKGVISTQHKVTNVRQERRFVHNEHLFIYT